jgi:hypothetical protein
VSPWVPCKRRGFIKKLRKLGFDGPFAGTRHHFMIYGENRLAIPSHKEYSIPQLRMMLREVELTLGRRITVDEWNHL